MFTKALRKSVILLAAYAVIIIGIFVVQFKNASIISEKIGNLHITLAEFITEDNSVNLKNRFSAVFNGINFYTDDENPAKIIFSDKEIPVELVSWKKDSPFSCVFNFTEGVSLRFSLSDESQNALLNLETNLPIGTESFSVPFGLSGGATLAERGDTKLQVNRKRNTWELSAGDIEDDRLFMTRKNPVVSYSFRDKKRNFSFSAVAENDFASESAYFATIENLENSIVSAFEQNHGDGTGLSEQEAVSYVAVRAKRGQYSAAVDAVPQGFKKSSNRTYLSAPYFNNLVKMTESLVRQQKFFSDMISASADNGSLDVFNLRNLSDYISMHPDSESVRKLFSETAARDLSDMTVYQAAGILSVYAELAEKNEKPAALLSSVVQVCADKIESSCSMDNNSLTVTDNGTFLTVLHASYVGDAILRYGKLIDKAEYIAGGRLIINSYLKDSGAFDSHSLGELYPIVVHDNTFYPHYVIIGSQPKGAVWAWTCAEEISYSKNDLQILITAKFPLSSTHYMIINGIEPFRSIYIYDIAFRTDPRFETYNSSGYVYQWETSSLLVKSRHRSTEEVIRLVYTGSKPKTENVETTRNTPATPMPESAETSENDFDSAEQEAEAESENADDILN